MHGVAKPLVELQLYKTFKHVKLERFVGHQIQCEGRSKIDKIEQASW